MQSTAIDFRPIQERFGAEVSGIDAAAAASAELIRALRQLIAERSFVLLRGQSLTEAQHVAFAASFGDTTVPWLNAVELDTLSRIRELPGRPGYTGRDPGAVYFVNGPGYRDQPDDGYLQGWHADMTHLQVPLSYALLFALESPSWGYETWLSDQSAAYEALDPETKRQADSLQILHRFQHVFPRLPPVVHPIALAHPLTGRRSIYGIPGVADATPLGMDGEAAAGLMRRLTAHLEDERFIHRHSWRAGDLLIWDNRCVLHRRGPQAKGQTRILRRVMAGDGDPHAVRELLLGH